MTKTYQSERQLISAGYSIEWGCLKGKKYCKATKDGKTTYASNLISLAKKCGF